MIFRGIGMELGELSRETGGFHLVISTPDYILIIVVLYSYLIQ